MKTFLDPGFTVEDASVPYISLEPWYVSGLCEGEGSFTYGRQRHGIRLRFALKLHEGDKALIFALKGYFGVGGVYWTGSRPEGPRSGQTGASWQYCVTDTKELLRIAEHFDPYPLPGTKGACYKIWRKMLALKISNAQANWAELQTLALQLSALALKGRRATKLQYNQNG